MRVIRNWLVMEEAQNIASTMVISGQLSDPTQSAGRITNDSLIMLTPVMLYEGIDVRVDVYWARYATMDRDVEIEQT